MSHRETLFFLKLDLSQTDINNMKIQIPRSVSIAVTISLFTMLIVSFQNCGRSMKFASTATNSSVGIGGDPTPVYPVPPTGDDPGSTICTGLGDGQSGSDETLGIQANLFVTPDTSHPLTSALDYANHGNQVMSPDGTAPVNLFFNNINVPNRSFDTGFVNENGQALTNADGTMLIEYFGLKMQSQIQLSDMDQPGDYQFGIESDDGSVFQLKDSNGDFQTMINNDSTHAVRTRCASQVVHFDQNTIIPFQLFYFQGPRYYIALRLFWRKVNSGDDLTNGCDSGALGNLDGTPASHNWKLLTPDNFVLPGNQTNPCANNP
jgi:hypothetical protein